MSLPLSRIASIEDLRQVARKRVPRPFFEYAESGSFGQLTLARNRAALDGLQFRQSVMRDVSRRALQATMAGERMSVPFVLAPVGLCGAVRANGEILSCRAAHAAGVQFTLSTNALLSIEDVAGAVVRPFWFQLYLARDREFSRELIARARCVGCTTLVLTMDLHVEGTRYADVHNGLGVPPTLTASNIWSILSHPRWSFGMLRSKRWSFGNYAGRAAPSRLREMARLVKEQLDPSFDARSIEWVRNQWPGKLIVKGILEPDDARTAIAHGADAVVVSNHGGRQLDSAPSTVEALPPIIDAVDGRAEVFVDSGIRSGLDVLKFLALGASGCLIGRSYVYGLGAFGEAGVAKAISILRDELDTAMALTGVTDVTRVPAGVVRTAPDLPRQPGKPSARRNAAPPPGRRATQPGIAIEELRGS